MSLETKLLVLRWTCLGMALSSYLLGGWMVLAPHHFWGLVGVAGAAEGAVNLAPRLLYGGAIMGEGVALSLIFACPVRYLGFLHYMMAYKLCACLALLGWLMGAESVPPGAWGVLAGWAAAGVIAAGIYPWGHWPELVRRYLHARADA